MQLVRVNTLTTPLTAAGAAGAVMVTEQTSCDTEHRDSNTLYLGVDVLSHAQLHHCLQST